MYVFLGSQVPVSYFFANYLYLLYILDFKSLFFPPNTESTLPDLEVRHLNNFSRWILRLKMIIGITCGSIHTHVLHFVT